MDYKKALLRTALHTLEMAVVFAVAYVSLVLFNWDVQSELVALFLAGVAKLGRESFGDYVNH